MVIKEKSKRDKIYYTLGGLIQFIYILFLNLLWTFFKNKIVMNFELKSDNTLALIEFSDTISYQLSKKNKIV